MKRLLLIILLAAPLTAQTTATFCLTSQQNAVRYMPLTISGRPSPDEDRVEAAIDPLLISAGLRVRF